MSILAKLDRRNKKDDPNYFGELLRDLVFAEEYGCYSCFDLSDGFVELPENDKMRQRLHGMLLGLNDEFEIGTAWHPILKVFAAWYWDGDGTLLVGCFDESGDYSVAINSDCKKDHDWEWKGRGWEPESWEALLRKRVSS